MILPFQKQIVKVSLYDLLHRQEKSFRRFWWISQKIYNFFNLLRGLDRNWHCGTLSVQLRLCCSLWWFARIWSSFFLSWKATKNNVQFLQILLELFQGLDMCWHFSVQWVTCLHWCKKLIFSELSIFLWISYLSMLFLSA